MHSHSLAGLIASVVLFAHCLAGCPTEAPSDSQGTGDNANIPLGNENTNSSGNGNDNFSGGNDSGSDDDTFPAKLDDGSPTIVAALAVARDAVPGCSSPIQFTLLVGNRSSRLLKHVAVTCRVTDVWTIDSNDLQDGGSCPMNNCREGIDITWPLGDISGGGSRSLQFTPRSRNSGVTDFVVRADGGVQVTAQRLVTKTSCGGETVGRILMTANPNLLSVGAEAQIVVSYDFRSLSNFVGPAELGVRIPDGLEIVDAGNSIIENEVAKWPLEATPAGTSGTGILVVRAAATLRPGSVLVVEAELTDPSGSRGRSQVIIAIQ